VGIIFGNYLAAAVRNPPLPRASSALIFGFAVTKRSASSRCYRAAAAVRL